MPKLLQTIGLSKVEPDTMAVLLAIVESEPTGAVFDVGANVGPFSLIGPAIFDREFVAFEPAPGVADALDHIVKQNKLRCDVQAVAVGDADGFATLYLSGVSDLSNSLQPGFRQAVGEMSVPLVTLDTYARRSGRWPSLIKVDTETTESAVLRGAFAVLDRRPWIVCEVLPGPGGSDLEALLAPHRYHYYQIEDSVPFHPRAEVIGDDRHHNWLFAPEEPQHGLWDLIARWRAAIDATAAVVA